MQIRRILAAIIVSAIMIQNSVIVLAEENVNTDYISEEQETEDVTQEKIENIISSVPDINTQLDSLYEEIGNHLGVDKLYIKQLHLLAGGKAVYAEKKPNIKNDLTTETMQAPMEIEGASINYIQADFIKCEDDKVNRPSKYYLPDAVYSVAYDVISLMSQRYYCNRGGYQIYYDSLQDDVKKNIAFYEAVLLYTGTKEETVDKFYLAYEKILYDKSSNENVVEEKDNGTFVIKDKFAGILDDIGINSDRDINNLALMLSFDKNLAVNDSVETLQETYNVPYKPNYTSRENMMIAAASLCGKVRYVWGGGHSGASYIDGINPMWQKFEELYPDEPTTILTTPEGLPLEVPNEGFRKCIKPSGSWCPIHGYSSDEYHGGDVYSLQQYIDISAEHLDSSELLDTKYRDMLSQVNYDNGINVHTLDGLDCSGFASWLYNQITDKYAINSTAKNFTQQVGLVPIEYGTEALPGDIFAWHEHIVIIVGKVNDNAKAFVTIEQTPNVLKYGVIYYKEASASDIALAKQIATEANTLIGGLDSVNEPPHSYCMDSVGIYTEREVVGQDTDEETDEESGEQSTNESGYITKEVWFPYYNDEDSEYNPWEYIPQTFEYYESRPADDGSGEFLTYYILPDDSSENTDEVSEDDSEVIIEHVEEYREIGRFADKFLDDDIIINGYEIPIRSMCAQDIIQHTITKLPISYISGYSIYDGDIFDKSQAATNLGVDFN